MSQGHHPRDEAVRYWWSKAGECLASAEREALAGSLTFSVNRLYYAAFYAVSAVLLHGGQSFTKHTGVRAAFHGQMVKPRLVDAKWGKLYDHLFEDRQEGDYIALVSFDVDYVQEALSEVREFLMVLKVLIGADLG